MDPTQFLTALLAIVVIDIVLAGDNAIVIALAARGLPPALQKRAIVWGAVGAVAVRSAMTLALVWLLKIPGLLLAGGALLVWIAWQLLAPDEPGEGGSHGPAQASFWGAMKTIVIADATMGLDNVLAVAGASHGSYLLVVLGLAISVPIVVWGSTLVLKLVERFPVVIYAGAAVLLWTAVSMMRSEPLLRPWRDEYPVASWLPLLLIPAVLGAAFWRSRRQAPPRRALPAAQAPALAAPKESTMLKVLVPVDGSADALGAVRHALAEFQRHRDLELHLLNVQPRVPHHIARFLGRDERAAWARQQADAALAGAADLLRRAGVPFSSHRARGERVQAICAAARRLGAHHIVLGSARHRAVPALLAPGVARRLLDSSPVPVQVVAGQAVPAWQRWSMTAGALLAGAGLFWIAAD